MRRFLLIAGVLALCGAAARADVRVFVTSSAAGFGLDLLGQQGNGTGTDPAHEDWPIDPFRPTYSTVDVDGNNDYAYDYSYGYYRVAAYPPIDAPSGTVDDPILINAAAGEWGYIWFQFRNEPDRKVNHLITEATRAGESQPTHDLALTYYVQNDRDGSGFKRWDGMATAPAYPEWHANPAQLGAHNGAAGIANNAGNPWLMFDNQAVGGGLRTGVALLGALRGAQSDAVFELRSTNVNYNAPPQPTIGEGTFFKLVPEPAGALWVAFAAVSLGLRTRRC